MLKNTYEMTDAERAAERKRIKRAIAERAITQKRHAEILQQLGAIDAEADRAADDHQHATAPIQAELEKINRQQIDDLAEQREADGALERRRVQLLDELAEQNERLEAATDKAKRLRNPLVQERREIERTLAATAALQGQLARTAPLSLQYAAWAAKRGLDMASARISTARSNRELAVRELAKAEAEPRKYDVPQFRRRAGQWDAEVKSAEKMLVAAREESDAAEAALVA